MGRIIRKAIAASLMLSLFSCGKTEKVEGIKGPEGDKGPNGNQGLPGPRGDKGERGDNAPSNGNQTPVPTPPQPQPIPTTVPSSYPPIVIVLPNQQCNRTICPQGTMLVCACLDGQYQTISILPSDANKFRIRNYGRCEDYARNLDVSDCIWWPRERPTPTVTVTAIPIPTPTVTVTAYPLPIPQPTVTVFPKPRPNEC